MSGTPVDVYVIFGVHERGTDYEWISAMEVWDEFSIDANGEGYNEAIAKARKEADEVRVVVFTTNWEKIQGLFHVKHRLESTTREEDPDAS